MLRRSSLLRRSSPLGCALTLVCALGIATACRKASNSSEAEASAVPPSLFGSAGCAGASQSFTPGQLPTEIVLATAVLGASSQVCAARDQEVLYVTGAGATVFALDFTGGGAPVETTLVQAGTVDALLALAGIASPAQLSGIAVIDATTLYAIDRTSNAILSIDRVVPDSVSVAYGLPSEAPGFADGLDVLARFAFTQPSMLAATSDGRVFVADPGNHALRVLQGGFVTTAAGSGAPFWADGSLQQTFFDTPTGVCIDCSNHVLVSETGAAGSGGHRIRELTLGPLTFFGQFGSCATLLGDGTAATLEGVGTLAELDAPLAPVVSETGELYWIDSGTGVLRARPSAAASAACPLFADCAAAQLAPTFTPSATLSLALTEGGVLYALDASAGKLWRITP
jgi:hypothetical protein